MTKKYLVALGLCLVSSLAFAASSEVGEIFITGNGVAESQPDFVTLSISITSICYNSSSRAKNENAKLANTLLEILKKYASNQKDKVLATGGVNQLTTEYSRSGSNRTPLCERKWRATNNLTIEFSDMARLPNLQDELLSATDDYLRQANGAIPATNADLSQPSFKLYKETQLKVRKLAQQNAYDDAIDQLYAFQVQCSFEDIKLARIGQPNFRTDSVFMESRASTMDTPVIPDQLSVNATWAFKWIFTPTANCP